MAGEDVYERFVAPINLHGAKLRPMFVESERIAATIHKVAEDEKVDLKVISTRGRSRSAAILLGSVTEGVIVEARPPAVSGRPIWNAWPRDLKMRPGFSNSSRPRACHPIPVNPT